MKKIELSSLDLRYEGHRMQSSSIEKGLLLSIMEKGIRDPLKCADIHNDRILLDGFKRYRCAKKLKIGIVPYISLGNDEAKAILEFIRSADAKSLNIMEQAKLIDELETVHKMSISDIAAYLEKSKAWVSVRSGVIKEMSEIVMEKILSGKFPAYNYMYTIRPFRRLNDIKKKDVDEFVSIVSGHELSTRNIDALAHGYFKGTDEVREQIKQGNLSWGLSHLNRKTFESNGETKWEQKMLRDLEIVQKGIGRIIYSSSALKTASNSFFAQAGLLAEAIVGQSDLFQKTMEKLYDQRRQTKGDLLSS